VKFTLLSRASRVALVIDNYSYPDARAEYFHSASEGSRHEYGILVGPRGRFS